MRLPWSTSRGGEAGKGPHLAEQDLEGEDLEGGGAGTKEKEIKGWEGFTRKKWKREQRRV